MAGLVLALVSLTELCIRLAFQRGEAGRLGIVAAHGTVVVPTLLLVVLLCVLGTAVIALPGRMLTAVLCCAACVASLAGFGLLTIAAAATLVAAGYLVGAHGASLAGLAGLAGAALGAPFLVLGLARTGWVRIDAIVLAFCVPAAVAVGAARRASGSASLAGALREAAAGSQQEFLARGERARIARELHDVVAHHISMIAVQAETGRLTTAGLPAAGAKRFAEIGDTARAGLTEMRRLLGVLREDAASASAAAAPDRAPQPGLAQLNELLDDARGAGGGCLRLIMSGPVTPLDPGTELAVYRIVQEALTNARRHAPGAAVDVELRFEASSLRVRVRDNGPDAGSAPGSGHGLLGMRERAQAVGGSLRAGPATGGGFMVEAQVPVLVLAKAGG
jgi:signal transduction histidine kinase